jgi:D-serine deaminase-like pyridoxal phosphate-dependent protein
MDTNPDALPKGRIGPPATIGQPRHELTTPALILDLQVVRRNIDHMAARTRGSTRLRPHVKSHKSAEIARMQIEAGAIGLTAATVWEAAVMAAAGMDDVLIANEVVGEEKIRQLAEIARTSRVKVAVDHIGNAEMLSAAAGAVGTNIGVLIDVDVGLRRCGVRSEQEARLLTERVSQLPGIHLCGVMGYEGHCALEPDRGRRAANVRTAMERLLAVADALRSVGFPVEIVSAGGTGTFDLTACYPGVTELQAGSYVFMDSSRTDLVPDFAVGLTVLATVVSRHQTTVVLDCGKKTVGVDFAPPQIVGEAAKVRYVSEEHTVFDVDSDCGLDVGQRVELIPSYCPTTINLHDVYYVVQDGIVIDIWPVLARGPGRGGWHEQVFRQSGAGDGVGARDWTSDGRAICGGRGEGVRP